MSDSTAVTTGTSGGAGGDSVAQFAKLPPLTAASISLHMVTLTFFFVSACAIIFSLFDLFPYVRTDAFSFVCFLISSLLWIGVFVAFLMRQIIFMTSMNFSNKTRNAGMLWDLIILVGMVVIYMFFWIMLWIAPVPAGFVVNFSSGAFYGIGWVHLLIALCLDFFGPRM
ncbi:hypothetical protein M3Y94_00896800 [Aphelenchoides besseyi]|nr:hypothetical protein M3Y94_00896800 [Aphelenchoides besseyi]KAI6223390.1 hypothetical protein M3Y95_00885100 [Aphelenchoides besseyi]